MTPEAVTAESRRPGRPRSEEADRAILAATIDEYAQGGLDALTMDAVAARAGVGKSTIYRRYPCKVDLVIAAIDAVNDEHPSSPDTGALRSDLRQVLLGLRARMLDPTLGPCVRMLIIDSHAHDELRAAHLAFIALRREGTKQMLRRGVERGELRASLDLDVVCDALVSVLFFRFLVSGAPLTDELIDELVDAVLRAYAT